MPKPGLVTRLNNVVLILTDLKKEYYARGRRAINKKSCGGKFGVTFHDYRVGLTWLVKIIVGRYTMSQDAQGH